MKACKLLRCFLLAVVMMAMLTAAHADVWLPASLTEIEAQAFMNASWLSGSCVIPEGAQSIGAQAFMNCSGITSLTIPGSVTTIGPQAFAGCTGLRGTVTIPEGCTVAQDAFEGCTELTVVHEQSDPAELFSWSIAQGEVTITAYKGDRTVTSVTVPATIEGLPVTTIDDYVFSSSRYLTSISLPASIHTIGDYAFAYASRLTSITLPTGVTSLGRYAFYYCSALSGTVQLIDAEIPSNVFTGCKNLCVLAYTSNADGTLTLARYYGSQKSVSVPGRVEGLRVTAIGREAFAYRTTLQEVSLPNSITSVGQSAFYYCTALTDITLPLRVTSLGPNAFYYCTALSTVRMPEYISSIGSLAFYNCTSLTGSYVFIDASVDASAFSSCDGVQAWCFARTGEDTVSLTACLSADTDLVVPAYVNDYAVTGMSDRAFGSCRNLERLTLPQTLTQISDEAFYRHPSLQSVSIPDTVTTIGQEAFYGCSGLQSVTLPASVYFVGTQAFANCTGLTALTVENDDAALSSYAFANCTALVSVTMPGDRTNVGDMAFNETPWLNEQIAILARQITQGCSSAYEKAQALHDWIILNTAYDLTYTHYGSEGVLFHGLGVCNAYTITYGRMLSAVGVSNMTVTGTATDRGSGATGSHAWTLVNLDGSWYHVDTTWDDPIPDGNERSTYFCLTDAEIAVDHTWDTKAYPAANGTTYSLTATAEVDGDDGDDAAPASSDPDDKHPDKDKDKDKEKDEKHDDKDPRPSDEKENCTPQRDKRR